jgi:hypothetical protein
VRTSPPHLAGVLLSQEEICMVYKLVQSVAYKVFSYDLLLYQDIKLYIFAADTTFCLLLNLVHTITTSFDIADSCCRALINLGLVVPH